MWARFDRNRLPRPHKYASIRPQIRLSRVAIGPSPRHQQTTDRRSRFTFDPLSKDNGLQSSPLSALLDTDCITLVRQTRQRTLTMCLAFFPKRHAPPPIFISRWFSSSLFYPVLFCIL